jgi:hypothetical protein
VGWGGEQNMMANIKIKLGLVDFFDFDNCSQVVLDSKIFEQVVFHLHEVLVLYF